MKKKTQIHCKTCDSLFEPKSENNLFCSRRCFKKDYYYRKKEELLAAPKFPDYTCPECDQHITLDFDIVKDHKQWTSYACPGCDTLIINVSEDIITTEFHKS